MGMIQKYLKEICAQIVWDDEYFDQHNDSGQHIGSKFIIYYNYKQDRKFEINTWFLTYTLQIKNSIYIFRNSEAKKDGILVMTLEESHPMWKKFALKINHFENARVNYKRKESEQTLLKVFAANYIAPSKESQSELGTVIELDGRYIILLDNEAEVALHLLATK